MNQPPLAASNVTAASAPDSQQPATSAASPGFGPDAARFGALLGTPPTGRMLFDALDDPLLLFDAATGAVLDANQAAAELAGGSVAALCAGGLAGLFAREDGSAAESSSWPLVAKARGPYGAAALVPVGSADGRGLLCRLTVFPAAEGNGPACLVLRRVRSRDILESRLQDSEIAFAAVLPLTAEGAWSWTVATNEVLLSSRWKEQLGYSPGEFPQTFEACAERLHPEDVDRTFAVLRDCAAGETSAFTLEFRLRHRDGSYRWMLCRGAAVRDADGRGIRLAGANIDITAQKEAEQALRESEARFRLLAQNTPDAIFLHDMGGNVLDVNDQACLLLGYDRAALTRLNVTDFEISCPAERLHAFWDVLEPGPFSFEGLARCADGSTFPTEIRGVAFHERGRTLSLVAARDLTLRKRYEQGLAEARDAAMAASRAKSEFLASISHEIRTPMNIILGMAELLRETVVTSAQKRYLTGLEDAGRLLLHLLNDILDLSLIEANKLELRPRPFDPAALVGAVREFMRVPAEEKGLSLTVRVEAGLPSTVVNDPDRLRQVLVNLIWNAVKFTPSGTITITVAGCEPSDGAPGVRIEVADTGIGIAPEDRDRIFDPFTQAADSAGHRPAGTGLGLAISKRLVVGMGGEIGLQSQPGNGARFFFSLPSLPQRQVRPKPQAVRPRDAVASPSHCRRRLLVVEDSPANQELLRLFLEKEPYDIVVAETGKQALEYFAPGRFDAILMDMEMPEMDGCAATEAIRRLEAVSGAFRTPVLMLSAHAFAAYEAQGLAAGCDAFLTKPVRRAVLLDALRSVMADA